MELRSDNATYETFRMYSAELAINQIGESNKGRIISLNPSGLLVKTDDNLVGKVNIKDILSGKYRYVKETNSLLGKDKSDAYHLADKVEIIIKDANKEKRTVDFSLVEKVKEKELVKILKR
jgi:ribonuclease R